MCLTVISTDPSSIQSKTFYKVLKIVDGELLSLYFGCSYKPGITKAKDPKLSYFAFVDGEGIHLYTTKERALKVCYDSTAGYYHDKIVVAFTCYKKDFLAFGVDDDIAFTQVFLSKDRYERALKASAYSIIE